jgi:hypothetical protein
MLFGLFASIPCCCKTVEVTPPVSVHILTQLIEALPRVQTRIMAVVKYETHGIVTDGLDTCDDDILLAGLQRFLARSVTSHFGAGRVHAQILEREAELNVFIDDNQQPGVLA